MIDVRRTATCLVKGYDNCMRDVVDKAIGSHGNRTRLEKQKAKRKETLFEEISKRDIKCEVCGSPTVPMAGAGWDYDRIACTDMECGAEMVFMTTFCVDDLEVEI